MAAQHFDFDGQNRCERGSTFKKTLAFYSNLTRAEIDAIESGKVSVAQQASIASKALNLTGSTVNMQVKTLANAELVLALTTANGRATITANEVFLSVDFATTTTLLAGTYYYDLEITSPGGAEVIRHLQGNFVVDREVTT